MTPEDQDGDNQPGPEMVTIQWRDLEFQVPKDRAEWDMNIGFEFEEGNRLRGLMILFAGSAAPAAVASVRARIYQQARTAGELEEFLEHASEICKKECVGSL
jgi:hypothetical protein